MTKPQKHIEAILTDAAALAASKTIRSEEARELLNLFTRYVETVAHGEPKTPKIQRHHG